MSKLETKAKSLADAISARENISLIVCPLINWWCCGCNAPILCDASSCGSVNESVLRVWIDRAEQWLSDHDVSR